MLKLYLRWFENEPVDALLPVKGEDAIADLAMLGAFKAPRRTRRVLCRDCGEQQSRHVYEAGDHRLLPCMACGGSVELQGPPFESVQMEREWLPQMLSRPMAGLNAKPEILLPDRAWHLANIEMPGGEVSAVLLRCGWRLDYHEVAKVIRKAANPRTVILTTARMHPDQLDTAGRVVVPIVNVAKLGPSGLWLERDALIERYLSGNSAARKLLLDPGAPPEEQLWFELGADNAWLRVKRRLLRLVGKQRLFVASIARAHIRGLAHKRFADAVNDAGYDDDIRSLSQICTRREFRDFIGIGDGLV